VWQYHRARPHIPTASAQVVTGAIGGYLGITTSLNGPPPVLLLTRAHIPPLVFIVDLAGYFVVTNITSLGILWSRSEVPHAVLWPMLPACVAAGCLGNLIGSWSTRRLPATVFRSAVIVLVIVAGMLTIATG